MLPDRRMGHEGVSSSPLPPYRTIRTSRWVELRPSPSRGKVEIGENGDASAATPRLGVAGEPGHPRDHIFVATGASSRIGGGDRIAGLGANRAGKHGRSSRRGETQSEI